MKIALDKIYLKIYNRYKQGKMTMSKKRYTSAELIKIVEKDGWVEVRVKGSHHHFHHPSKTGIVTIVHPEKDAKPGTAGNILRQAGIKIENFKEV
jgi:predicted RNA binding protein YcfA (HicA-like mRNA interferase family)